MSGPARPAAPVRLTAPRQDPIDGETIRMAYEAALGWQGGERRPVALADQLVGQMHMLVEDLEQILPRLRGKQQPTAECVLARSRALLGTDDAPLWDLGVQCRALLTLVRQSGLVPVGPTPLVTPPSPWTAKEAPAPADRGRHP